MDSQVEARVNFSGTRDTNILIFLDLELDTLYTLFLVDKTLFSFYDDQDFWMNMVTHKFGVSHHKPGGMTFRDQYITLTQTRDVLSATEMGRLDIIISLKNKFKYEDSNFLFVHCLGIAAKHGHPHILEWLYTCLNLLPKLCDANDACERGHLNVLQWMACHKIYPNELGADFAAKEGHTHILDWIENQLATRNTRSNDSPRAEWLAMPTTAGANLAVMHNQVTSLRWLARRRTYPERCSVTVARRNGYLSVLYFLRDELGWTDI